MKVQFINWIFHASFLIAFAIADDDGREDSSLDKNGRFLSMFEIINFPNEACTGDAKNGTCYTSQECDNKGGTKDGDCASGYGVCCVFDVNCGAKTSENNTYFTSAGTETGGTCSIQVCPGENICQLRLDFDSFVINGPYTSTLTIDGTLELVSKCIFGSVNAGGEKCMTRNSQCYLDSFSVTSPNGGGPPVLCGTNSGEHMYVDATDSYCNTLGFALSSSTSVSRSWSVRVSQLECDYNNLAPQGCTQYFFGQSTGTFRSFNYASGKGYHLANQNQNICFRREKSNSKVCFTTQTFTDFQVSYNSNAAPNEKGNVGAANCCGYTANGKAGGYDCLMIPSAIKEADSKLIGKASPAKTGEYEGFFCGNGGLLSTDNEAAANSKTICSKRSPFMVRFTTDSYEWETEGMNSETLGGTKGFELVYILK